jgi:hypothetical protein
MKRNDEAQYELMDTFEKNSFELYWLAYLLTGNEDCGVHAFSNAIDLDEQVNVVFDGFMNRWARKLIVVEALGAIEAELRRSIARVARTAGEEIPAGARWMPSRDIAKKEFEEAVIAIDAFPRCAMLLTLFEGMSIREAAILLHADDALTGAAGRIGIVLLLRNLVGIRVPDRHAPEAHAAIPVFSLGWESI